MVHSAGVDAESDTIYEVGTNMVVTREQMKSSFLMGTNFIELLFNFAIRFNMFNLTQQEVALFSALMIITPGTKLLRPVQVDFWSYGIADQFLGQIQKN